MSEPNSRTRSTDAPTGDVPTDGAPITDAAPALFLVRGDASPEEVAALTAVLQGIAAAAVPAEEPPVRSEWAAPHRMVRTSYSSGRGGWRSSAMPR